MLIIIFVKECEGLANILISYDIFVIGSGCDKLFDFDLAILIQVNAIVNWVPVRIYKNGVHHYVWLLEVLPTDNSIVVGVQSLKNVFQFVVFLRFTEGVDHHGHDRFLESILFGIWLDVSNQATAALNARTFSTYFKVLTLLFNPTVLQQLLSVVSLADLSLKALLQEVDCIWA